MQIPFRARLAPIVLAVIVIAAALTRLHGIGYGLPFLYDVDEPIFVDAALGILRDLDPNPHWFGAPAGPTIYMLVGLYASAFAAGRATGIFGSARDFAAWYHADPSLLYMAGRLASAAFGIAAVWLTYLIGRRLFNRTAGWIAAALVALSPTHVQVSQLVRMDVQMGVFLLAAFWFTLSIAERGAWRDYVLSGTFAGLATVTKFPAAVFATTIALAHLLRVRGWRGQLPRLAAAGAACLGAAFIASPFLFIDYRTAWADVVAEARPTQLSATGQGLLLNLAWYARFALPEAVTPLGALLAAVGAGLCLRASSRGRWLLVASALSFLLFISALSLRWVRWLVPAVPFLCLLIAHAVDESARLLRARWSPRAGLAGGLLLAGLTLAPLGLADLEMARESSGVDTRSQAADWMLDNVPGHSRVLLELNAPQLPSHAYVFFFVDSSGDIRQVDPAAHPDAIYRPLGQPRRLSYLRQPEKIAAEGIDYVVMSNYYDRYLAERDSYPDEIARYEAIMRLGQLVFRVDPVPGHSRGQTIRVFRMPAAPAG